MTKIKSTLIGAGLTAILAVPGDMYSGTSRDVNTFGVGATFVSSTRVSENTVYTVAKAVFENCGGLDVRTQSRTAAQAQYWYSI